MKKHNLAEFFKSKSFYALLCIGALAIIVISMVGFNHTSDNGNNSNLADLNEQVPDVAQGNDTNSQDIAAVPDTDNAASSSPANKEAGSSKTEAAQSKAQEKASSSQAGSNVASSNKAVSDGSLLEYDAADDPNSVNAGKEAASTKASDQKASTEKKSTAKANTQEAKEVMNPDSLTFKADKGLLWPVNGNVLMNYSADRVIYFQTLEQFKCNPAIIIDAEVGTKVLNAAKGVITSITNEDETGVTVTESIGSGYSLVYGQLKKDGLKVEVGDLVDEGTVIGVVAEPTRYYTVEGSNLYFEVIKDDSTVDPMLLLR